MKTPMKTLVMSLVLAACGASAPPPPPSPANSSPPRAEDTAMPAEVSTLLERWETCWHFRGEEAYSPERQQEILDGQHKWCPGDVAELARLRAKYKDRADVQQALDKTNEWQ
jgi:hypothetical protein